MPCFLYEKMMSSQGLGLHNSVREYLSAPAVFVISLCIVAAADRYLTGLMGSLGGEKRSVQRVEDCLPVTKLRLWEESNE